MNNHHLYPNPYPIQIFACGQNQDLALSIAKKLGLGLESLKSKYFSNGEFIIHQKQTVRFRDVFVICQPRQGDKLHLSYDLDECYSLVFALKQGSPASITVIMPYLPNSRQDRASNHREPILSQKVPMLLQASGADKVVVLKLHNAASYNAHTASIEMELIETDDLIIKHIKSKNFDLTKFKIVAPDASAAKYARIMSKKLGITNEIIIVDKDRDHSNVNDSKSMQIIGEPKGYDLIQIDDMGDTLGTAVGGFLALKAEGAKDIYFAATHGIISGKATENIEKANFAGFWVTDTCYISPEKASKIKNLEIISVENRIADVIKNLHDGESVSDLWNGA